MIRNIYRDDFLNKKELAAFSLAEMLMSVLVLSIITLSLADFASDIFDVSFAHTNTVNNVSQTRDSATMLSNGITEADYIFPPGISISFDTQAGSKNINTSDSVAYLINDRESSESDKYYLKIIYMDLSSENQGMYIFSSNESVSWPENTLPISYFENMDGITGILFAGQISQGVIEYTLNQNNGVSDTILKGTIGGVSVYDEKALIKAVNWELTDNNAKKVYIGGVSENVPRFIE